MKKGCLFFIVPLVILLLVSCGGNQFRKGSVSIELDDTLLSKAFPENQKKYRAGDEKEEYSATVEISGGNETPYTETKTFTRSEAGNDKVVFVIDNLTPGIIVNIKLSLKYNDDVLYSGEVNNFSVDIGNNPVNIKLKSTGIFNKFTHAKVSFESEHGTVPSEFTVKKGYVLTEADLPELTQKGFIFDGWYVGGERYTAGSEITESITLVAKWLETSVPEDPEEPIVDPTPQEPVEPEPEEPIVEPVEPEPEEPIVEPEEPDEGVSFVMEMSVNGTAVADGGDILVGDITNATLAIDYANPEDSALNIRGTAKMKIGEDELESSTLYMPMQLNLPSILNGRTLDAGTYTIEIYLFNDEIAAEDPLTFTFNVKNEVSVESGIVADIPDFEVVVTYYQDNDYYGVSVQAVAEDECLDVGYDYLWIINGTTFGNASNGLIIFPDGLVSSYGNVPLDFTEANQNVVTCMITNPVTGQSETRSEDFGIKRIGAGSGNVSGNQETIVMQ